MPDEPKINTEQMPTAEQLTKITLLRLGAQYWLVLMILFSGMVISHKTNDWMWCSRAGALITALYLGKTTCALSSDVAAILRRKTQDNNDVLMNRSSQMIDSVILVWATIVWGFGDLLGKLFT